MDQEALGCKLILKAVMDVEDATPTDNAALSSTYNAARYHNTHKKNAP